MSDVQLGKIQSVSFGACGYQDAQFGLNLTLGGDSWGVSSPIVGGWATPRSPNAKWSEADRLIAHGKMCVEISKLLSDAKVETIDKLVGIPVRCYFKNFNELDRFEVLKEVL